MTFSRRHAIKRNFITQIDVHPGGGPVKLDDLTIDTSRNYTRTGALLQNIGYLSQAIQQLQVASISYINFAGLISIGALTVGIIRPVPLVEIFAPYGLSIVFIFLIQLYTDIERLITIKEFLEEHANRQMQAPAFLGLNDLSSDYRGRKSVRLIAFLLAIPLALFIYHSIGAMASLTSSTNRHGHWWMGFRYLNYFGLAFSLFVIIRAGYEMFRAREDAICAAKSALGDPRRITGDSAETANTSEATAGRAQTA